MTETGTRHIGLDIHKRFVIACGIDEQQTVVLKPRRVALSDFSGWIKAHLKATDRVALEAGMNAWYIHDLLLPQVAEVIVVHPRHVQMIASSAVKTDKRDALTLARLLAARLLPAVWVPPLHVRLLRTLVKHRQVLMKQRVAGMNRLQGLLYRHNLTPPDGNPFTASNRAWWLNLELNPIERLHIRHDWQTFDQLEQQLQEVEAEFAAQSVSTAWKDQVPFLLQLPGIGLISAMTILSAIGDITRFPTADQLVGYAGLGASVHASGQTYRQGGITKQGRRELRSTLIESAWSAVRYSEVWQQRFAALAQRRGKQKAITAIARKLLVVIWHVLTKQCVDQQGDAAAIERSMLRWATRHRLAHSLKMSRPTFTQQALTQLGLGVPALADAG